MGNDGTNTKVTQEMCASGFSAEEFPLEEAALNKPTHSENAMDYVRIEVVANDQFCGGRHGDSQYLASVHPVRKIRAVVETIFDNGQPQNQEWEVNPQRKRHIGCSQWQHDQGVQHYVRRIISAEFVY